MRTTTDRGSNGRRDHLGDQPEAEARPEAGVGAAAGLGLEWGKVRSNTVGVLSGALCGMIALWASWIFWLKDIFSKAGENVSLA